MTTQKRAPKGGTVAINGEFYEGGKFLPSTQKGKGKPHKKTGKQQIAPYQWEVPPTPEHKSIWATINAFCQWGDGEYEEFLVANENLEFDGENYCYPGYALINARKLKKLKLLWNGGVRWYIP